MSFEELISYNIGNELAQWSMRDLIELEAMVNSEIQDRMIQDEDDYFHAEDTYDGSPWDA